MDGLLVDTQANKARYLDMDGDNRHVTVSIGYARLEENRHHVLVDRLGSDQLRALPDYNHGGITRDFEEQVGRACHLGSAAATPDFYENDAFRGRRGGRAQDDGDAAGPRERAVRRDEVEVDREVRRTDANLRDDRLDDDRQGRP